MSMFVNRNKIRGALAERGMTQDDLAKILNICRQPLWKRMTNRTSFTENEMVILLKMFGKSVFYLDDDVGNQDTRL